MARILVPLDGSKAAQRALRHALQLARDSGAELRLLNVQPPMPMYGPVRATMNASQYHAACEALAKKALQPAQRLLARSRVKYLAHVFYGKPGETIVEAARRLKCAAIVMGTRGLDATGNLLLGSVATRVIHRVGVPVTLVK